MAWLPPENELDIEQRDFLDNADISKKNFWIKGFAGSGKSVLLAYLAKKIKSFPSSSNVLLIGFTQSLVEMFKAAFRDEMELKNVHVDTYYGFMNGSNHYDYILCDEVQDLTPRVIREMNARGSHIIVAGDSNQSIFTSDPRWGEATVTPSEIESLINGDSFELGIIHRLPRSIIDAVQRFLPRMNIFSAKRDMTKKNVQIRLCEAQSEDREVKYVMEKAGEAVNEGYTSAVLIPTQAKIIQFANQALHNADKPKWEPTVNQYGKPDFGSLNSHLSRHGIKMQYVGNGYGNFSENDRRIVLMTFHSAKGLDFENVFIPYANSSMYINPDETLAKTLFMVAMTRTRVNLYITYYGYPSDYLDAFKSNCSHIDIAAPQTTQAASTTSKPWGF